MSVAGLPIEIWHCIIAPNLVRDRDYCALMCTNSQLYQLLLTDLYAHKCRLSASLREIRATDYHIVDKARVEHNHNRHKYCFRNVLSYNNRYIYGIDGKTVRWISVKNNRIYRTCTNIKCHLNGTVTVRRQILGGMDRNSRVCDWYKKLNLPITDY